MAETKRDIIVIGASAGGVKALQSLVSGLPADLPATVFIAMHMAAGYTSHLPELLSARGPLPASHPVDGEIPTRGRIYIAPPDTHLQLRGSVLSVARGPKENGHRPSIDALFRSAATSYGARVIGVVLTGHLDCGTAGLFSVKARGGLALVQDPAEAEAPSMPRSALDAVSVDHVAKLHELAALLSRLVTETASTSPAGLPTPILELEGERPGVAAPLVCPTCQGMVTEAQVGAYEGFRCHVGHAFSLRSMVLTQAESLERALWSAVRALEESGRLMQRLAEKAQGPMRQRFDARQDEQHQHADLIRRVLLSPGLLSAQDASSLDGSDPGTAGEDS